MIIMSTRFVLGWITL